MSLYAIGDLHLHFQSELKAPGQLNDPVWQGHEERFRKNCEALIRPEDTLVLVGDHSWGKDLSACKEDLEYICSLPGRKILTRGNHDMFWDAGKTKKLNEIYAPRLLFLQDDYAPYGEYAIVATKGFTFEGPFYLDRSGKVIAYDREKAQHAKKLVDRELKRLRRSFEAARGDGYRKFIMFLHYPPTNIMETASGFTDMAEEYGAQKVIYAHCHGKRRFHDSIMGERNGVEYQLVSGDYLEWMPYKVLGDEK